MTDFFRDGKYYNTLTRDIIPKICNVDNYKDINVWSIGCSTGEDAYSIAILIAEYLEENQLRKKFKVFGTDLDQSALEIASKGLYPSRAITDIKPHLLAKYFTKKDGDYLIQPSLRKNIIFSRHNILSNPPFSKMDMISCRNMLIYVNGEAQQKTLKNIANATNNEIVSSNEELLSTIKELQSVNAKINTVNAELEQRNLQLSELNADFENLINSTSAIDLLLDKDLRLRKYTKSIKPIFDFVDSNIGQNLNNFSLPYKELINDIKIVLKTRQTKKREVNIVNSTTGEHQWYLQSINPCHASQDEITGVVVNYSDITSLRTNDSLLSGLIKSNPGIIYIFNIENMSNEYTSPISTNILGYSPQELKEMGTNIFPNIIHPEEIPGIIARNEELKTLSDTEVNMHEYRVLKKKVDGVQDIGWLLSYETPYDRNASGEVSKVIGIAMDISKLKQSQTQLEKTTKLIASLSAMSPSHAVLINADTDEITFSSNSLMKHLGYLYYAKQETSENFETYINRFSTIENANKLIDNIKSLIDNNQDKTLKVSTRAEKQSGEFAWLEWTIKPYQWNEATNKIEILMLFISDITELKNKELSLKIINTELEEFTYVSSHDLQQPLNTILSSLKVLKEVIGDSDNEIVNRCLSMMESTSNGMKNNIKSILEYSKVKSDASFAKVDLNVVITYVINSLESAITESTAKITIKQALPIITGDAQLLASVFQNLITNAIKYQSNGKKPIITISSSTDPMYHIIKVKDNGIGISKDHQSRIFTLFQRLHDNSTYEGAGIGLAHASKIMRIHNGKIEVKSVEGKGSTFSCYFLK